MKTKNTRRLGVAVALFAALAAPAAGRVFAQEQSPPAEVTTTATTQNNNDDGFPWGLLGLLGLGGLAGLTRREAPRRVEAVDASRRV